MHRAGIKRPLHSDQLANLLIEHDAFLCHETRDRVIALLSLTKEKAQLTKVYDGADEDFLIRCCVAFNANLEFMARLAKTLGLTVFKGALTYQRQIEHSSSKHGQPKLHMVAAQVGCDILTSPRNPQACLCASCKSLILKIPANIVATCKMFCVGAMSRWRHLLVPNAELLQDLNLPPTLFLDDDEEIWNHEVIPDLATFCDDSDFSDGENDGAASSAPEVSHDWAQYSDTLQLSAPLCMGYFSFKQVSEKTAEIYMSLALFAYLVRYAPSQMFSGTLSRLPRADITAGWPKVNYQRKRAETGWL